jgi:hypothetical protein
MVVSGLPELFLKFPNGVVCVNNEVRGSRELNVMPLLRKPQPCFMHLS